jgi:DNA-binding MarR family transcriptional regulator
VSAKNSLDDALWAASDIMRSVFARRVAELGLTPPQALVLRLLVQPLPMKELAAQLLFDPSYVTALVDGLEERGLAERLSDHNDRRVKLIAATEEGRATQRALKHQISRTLPGIGNLTNAEQLELARLLMRALSS